LVFYVQAMVIDAHQDAEEQVEHNPGGSPDPQYCLILGQPDGGQYQRDSRQQKSRFLVLK